MVMKHTAACKSRDVSCQRECLLRRYLLPDVVLSMEVALPPINDSSVGLPDLAASCTVLELFCLGVALGPSGDRARVSFSCPSLGWAKRRHHAGKELVQLGPNYIQHLGNGLTHVALEPASEQPSCDPHHHSYERQAPQRSPCPAATASELTRHAGH